MANFTDILNKKSSGIEPPKALPTGTYVAMVDGQFQQVTAKTGTPGFQFNFKLLQPYGDDVDQAALAEVGGVQGKGVKNTIYVSEGNEFFLKQFLVDHLGIEEGDKTIGEMLAEAPGRQVLVSLKHTTTQQGDPRMIHVVDRTAKV